MANFCLVNDLLSAP